MAAISHWGIDFGAKLAGTTAVCYLDKHQLHWWQSSKKQDADAWLRSLIAAHSPQAIFLDAPLSLPSAYQGGGGKDYHYRICDRLVGGMSPMFLGGLTARAMQLRASFAELPFYEAYPAQLVRTAFVGAASYKTDLDLFLEKMATLLPYPFALPPTNWHQVDAALAWLTGWRHGQGEAMAFGEAVEGIIWA